MRGLIALCMGLVLVLGAGTSLAGISEGTCGVCQCLDDGSIPLCTQDMSGFDKCVEACGSTNVIEFSGKQPLCSDVPGCPQFGLAAPATSAYGMAAVLVGLAGIGVRRLRKRRAV